MREGGQIVLHSKEKLISGNKARHNLQDFK